MRVFEGKLKWTELLAMNKDVTLQVTDETVASEEGIKSMKAYLTTAYDQSDRSFEGNIHLIIKYYMGCLSFLYAPISWTLY